MPQHCEAGSAEPGAYPASPGRRQDRAQQRDPQTLQQHTGRAQQAPALPRGPTLLVMPPA